MFWFHIAVAVFQLASLAIWLTVLSAVPLAPAGVVWSSCFAGWSLMSAYRLRKS